MGVDEEPENTTFIIAKHLTPNELEIVCFTVELQSFETQGDKFSQASVSSGLGQERRQAGWMVPTEQQFLLRY